MGEDGDSAGRLDEPDRLEGVELVLLGVGPAAVAQPVGREGVGDGGYDPDFDEGGGDVRAADRAVPGDAGDLLPGDGHVEGAELADHLLGAGHPVVADEFRARSSSASAE
ncbi:hypothetical protein SMICM304S_05494 [Streptomyces microflavus]